MLTNDCESSTLSSQHYQGYLIQMLQSRPRRKIHHYPKTNTSTPYSTPRKNSFENFFFIFQEEERKKEKKNIHTYITYA